MLKKLKACMKRECYQLINKKRSHDSIRFEMRNFINDQSILLKKNIIKSIAREISIPFFFNNDFS